MKNLRTKSTLLFASVCLLASSIELHAQILLLNEFETRSVPVGIDVTPSGNVIIANQSGLSDGKIFTSEGISIAEFGAGGGNFGLAVTPANEILVARNTGSLSRYSIAGTFITDFSTSGPNMVETNEAGDIFVTEQFSGTKQVNRYTSNGSFVGSFGAAQFGGDSIAGIAFDAADNALVVNSTSSRVDIFSDTGAFIGSIAEDGMLDFPYGLSINATKDVLYVTESGGGGAIVKKFSLAGEFMGEIDGGFVNPLDVAVTPRGEVYVSDAGQAKAFRYFDVDAWRDGTYFLSANLRIGDGRPAGDTLEVLDGYNLAVTGSTTVETGGTLRLGSGTFSSSLILVESDGTVNLLVDYSNLIEMNLVGPTSLVAGAPLINESLIHGNGRIESRLNNSSIGELRTVSNNRLHFIATGNSNDGEINILDGTIEFDADLINRPTGFIAGHGNLIVNQGLSNSGVMAFSGGNTAILGDVDNQAGGIIVTSGSATTTFFDDVVNNGIEIRTNSGSATVILGLASGSGSYTGTGEVFMDGDLRPGNSPASLSFEGNLSLGSLTTTEIEIGGLEAGSEYDQLAVAGDLSIGGFLNVLLVNGHELGSGQQYEIADVAGDLYGLFDGFGEGDVVGTFDGTDLMITYTGGDGNDVVLFTENEILLGDVNLDGAVNLLDIEPFIVLLSSGEFQAEADCNEDGAVNLLDISTFIDLLSGS